MILTTIQVTVRLNVWIFENFAVFSNPLIKGQLHLRQHLKIIFLHIRKHHAFWTSILAFKLQNNECHLNCLWLNNFKILEKLEYLKWHASCVTSMLSTSNITTNYKILKARREAKSKASLPTIVFMLLE